MTVDQVERRIWIDATPSAVYGFFLDPVRLMRWQGHDAVVDARVGGDYRVTINEHDSVSGRFVELVPGRRLIFTWALRTGEGSTSATTVEVTFTPQGFGTSVQVLHYPTESAGQSRGGNVLDALTLYDRHVEGDGKFRCEWCGRPGQALPFYVQSSDREVEFAEPVLCAVCQGLVGYLHPHPSQQQQPHGNRIASESPDDPSGSPPPSEKSPSERHHEVREWAAGVVSGLLTERFVGEGRPRPDWAQGPTWTWPPAPPDVPVSD